MRRFYMAVFCLLLLCVGIAFAQTPGGGLGLQFGTGIAGSMSYLEIGLIMPKIKEKVFINIKVRAMSAITWTTFVNKDTNETASFHPVIVGALLGVGSVGPMVNGELRMYGGSDLFLGYSFTPYDSFFYDTGNLIPPNLTFAIWGYFGLEYFTSDSSSFFLQAGGGFKSLLVKDKQNIYGKHSSNPLAWMRVLGAEDLSEVPC